MAQRYEEVPIFTLAIEPLITEKAIICMWNLLSNTCYNYWILDTHSLEKKKFKKKKRKIAQIFELNWKDSKNSKYLLHMKKKEVINVYIQFMTKNFYKYALCSIFF